MMLHGLSEKYADGHFHYPCRKCGEERCSGAFGMWVDLVISGKPHDPRPHCGSCFAKEIKSYGEVLKYRDQGMPGLTSVN